MNGLKARLLMFNNFLFGIIFFCIISSLFEGDYKTAIIQTVLSTYYIIVWKYWDKVVFTGDEF